MNKCFFCDTELVWESDFMTYEIYGGENENDDSITSFWHCPNCGRQYTVSDPLEEERKNEYKKFWFPEK